ncbi:hypothetical protein [Bacillus sp. OK048]|uniref:hypothetical protein n=1 Tax=Bacillus sp. OK048 TaxID=1882761 RepID=UPI00088D4844|nr:hypothetical protein [Bacillus sp. OK048]SDN63700.1 hypothetical protein SAMN05443253_11570 [Bacillus sp. OK048]
MSNQQNKLKEETENTMVVGGSKLHNETQQNENEETGSIKTRGKERSLEDEQKALSVLSKVIEKVEEYVNELNLKKHAANKQTANMVLPENMFRTIWEWLQMLVKWRTLFLLLFSIALFFLLDTTIADFKKNIIDAFVNNSVLVLSVLLFLSIIGNVALKTIMDMTDMRNTKFHYDMYVKRRSREFEVFGPFMKESANNGEGKEPEFIIKTLDELKENLGKDTYIEKFLKWEDERSQYNTTIDYLRTQVHEVTEDKKDVISKLERKINDLEEIFGYLEKIVISELKEEFSPRLLHFPYGYDVYCLKEGVLCNKDSLWKTGMQSRDLKVDDNTLQEDPRISVLQDEQYLAHNEDMVTMKFDIAGEAWVFALYLTGDKIEMYNPKSNYGMMNLNTLYGTLMAYCYYFKRYKELKEKIIEANIS